MIYQLTEFFHPYGLSGTAMRGIADYRKKLEAVEACKVHPCHAVVSIANTSEIVFDNGKPPRKAA